MVCPKCGYPDVRNITKTRRSRSADLKSYSAYIDMRLYHCGSDGEGDNDGCGYYFWVKCEALLGVETDPNTLNVKTIPLFP